jgi:hypothetical protein
MAGESGLNKIHYYDIMDNTEIADDDIIKNKSIKNKKLKFKEERKALLYMLLQVVGVTPTNNIFYSHDIDNNPTIQQQILSYDQEIEKIFKVSSWPAYKSDTRNTVSRRYLSILKSVLKDMDVEFTSAAMKLNNAGTITHTTMYRVNLNNN